MMIKENMTRRTVLASMAGGAVTAAMAGPSAAFAQAAPLKGRIKQSVSRWCFDSVVADWDDFAKQCAEIGLKGIDLVHDPKHWEICKKYGLVATMVSGAGGIVDGLNDRQNHARCMEQFKKNIPLAAQNNLPNVITFSGNRKGKSDEEGWDACTEILKEAVKIAEDQNVTICMELLNSKVDHPDYQCDHTLWGAELCKRVGSSRFKLLYDIYHMQIMEGDVIRTIRDNIEYIAHFHTAGIVTLGVKSPNRKDIDDNQELNYRPIMRAIADLQEQGKYDGYVAHEFVPLHGMQSLKDAIAICDV